MRIDFMATLDASLSVPEAAFVTGQTVRGINHEIDAGVIAARDRASRHVTGADLIYLGAVRELRTDLGLALRRRLRTAIVQAHEARRSFAQVGHLTVALDAVEIELAGNLSRLERLRNDEIEERSDILRGEPVLKGTRVPARQIADMVRDGADPADLTREFDLTPAQVAAAVLFDRVDPRQGRPPRKGRRVPAV